MNDQQSQSLENRPLKLIDAALNLQQAGEYSRALEILSLAREEAGDYPPVHLLLGLTYQELGQTEQAEASLRQSLALDSGYPEALQALGLLLVSQGNLAEAIGLLRQHLKSDPENATSLKALSAALLQDGRPEEALRYLQETWRQTQGEEPGVQLGRLLFQLGAMPQAEEILRQVVQQLPSPRTYAEWGLALTLLQRYEDACQALKRAIELNPRFDRAWRGLAHCYDRMGESVEAVDAAERALTINRNHYRNWQAKGDALLSLGQYREALMAARQGIELIDLEDEEAYPVLFELVRQEYEALVGLSRFDEALERLEMWRRQFPMEERFPSLQVSLLRFLGRYQEVLVVIDSLDNSTADRMAPYGYEALHAAGQPEAAWELVEPQLDVETKRQSIRLNRLVDIGVFFYLQGEPVTARAIFEQLHRFDPQDPRIASNLGFVLIGEGKIEEANTLLRLALDAPEEAGWQPLIYANLGYISMLQDDLEQAEVAFQKVLGQSEEDQEAILRVAYWCHDEVVADYSPHPWRFLPIRLYVLANQATLRLAIEDSAGAEELIQQILDDASDAPLGYLLLGMVRLAQNQLKEAQQAWEQALDRAKEPEERESLEEWLKGLSLV